MDSRRQRLDQIVERARGLDRDHVAAFLDEACGSDAGLRRDAERLLQSGEPETDMGTAAGSAPSPTMVEVRTGRYRLLRRIGEGGMGIVWEAEQEHPVRRRVALKLIKHGLEGEQILARFAAERQALALMNHPNVARVLDAGKDASGRPFFVMEYIQGIPLSDYCDRHNLTTRERLELLIQACAGVLYGGLPRKVRERMPLSRVALTVAKLYEQADGWAAIVEGVADIAGWKDYARIHAASVIRAVIESRR